MPVQYCTWKVLRVQTEPEEPSPGEQEEEESSREEKSTEEHWARGRQEEEDEKLPWKPFCCSPNLPTLLLAENVPLELLKPRPWEELESDTVKEEEPRPWEELEEEPEAWMEAEAKERPKLI